ncbi:MAG: hypothetical protein JWM86_604 [Thermoleophilia bacterium]|nr:hypothetical protein [Thermoleophilia bacterium]
MSHRMDVSATSPALLLAVACATIGTVLLLHARVQSRLLRARIATGAGTIVMDPMTGLFSADAAWQCVRAEASRAARLARPLDVWVGIAPDSATLDVAGREVLFGLPPGAIGVRVAPDCVCVVTCADQGAVPEHLSDELTWTTRRVPLGEDAALEAFSIVSEVRDAA